MSRVMKTVAFFLLCALVVAVPCVWAFWAKDGLAVCTATGNQDYPQIISDGGNGAIITWRDHRGTTGYDIYAQLVDRWGEVQWAVDGVAICTVQGDQSDPVVTSDGAGGAIVAWYDNRSGYYNIYAQRVNGLGEVQWRANGVTICAEAYVQRYPTITSDNAGGAIVAWDDSRSGASGIYAQRVNASGTVQWAASGVPICTGYGVPTPQITFDDNHGAIVAWSDSRSGASGIYAQKVNASGIVQWAANGVRVMPTGTFKITSDGSGGALLTRYTMGQYYYKVYVQRVHTSGVVAWAANGVAVCALSGNQMSSTIASDGGGGAIVAWSDRRSGNYDIYAQRVDALGVPQWTELCGLPICMATGDQSKPQIISEGAGGAIVTWIDYRSGNNDVYSQRVDHSGVVQCPVDGVALCTDTHSQLDPTIASDGLWGAIVAWEDSRNGSWDIYALKVTADCIVPTATDAPPVPVKLHQNYPNPFNPATTVTYSIPEKCSVKLTIYDVSGTCIACLVDKQEEKGSYTAEWNGKDAKGNSVASGVYFCRLTAGNQTISKKMVLLR